jgi:hypothetical protein
MNQNHGIMYNMTKKQEKVNSITHLRELIKAGTHSYALALNYGLYSRKTIRAMHDGKFRIVNHIDDSKETLTEAELFTESNIGRAITKGAFFVE